MAVLQVGFTSFSGLSTDTKPTAGMIAGVRFYETDTKKSFIYDGSAWAEDVGGGQPLEADQFTPWTDTTYKADDLVLHGGILYKAKADINSPTGASPDTDSARWDMFLGVSDKPLHVDDFVVWQPSTAYAQNDLVLYNKVLYIAKGAVPDTSTTTPNADNTNWGEYLGGPTTIVSITNFVEWNDQDAYNEDDLVHYNGVLYKCLLDVTHAPSGGNNPTPDTDPTHWDIYLGLNKEPLDESDFTVWAPNTAYPQSTLVLHDTVMYKAKANVPNNLTDSPDVDEAHWDIYLGTLVEEASIYPFDATMDYDPGDMVTKDGKIYVNNGASTPLVSLKRTIQDTTSVGPAPPPPPMTKVGDYYDIVTGGDYNNAKQSFVPHGDLSSVPDGGHIVFNGSQWVDSSKEGGIAAGPWDPTDWEEIAGASTAPDAWTDTTYAAGDIVEHNGIAYKAKNAIASPTGTSPDVDTTNWEVYYGTIAVPTLSVIPTYDELVGILDYAKAMAGKLAAQGLV